MLWMRRRRVFPTGLGRTNLKYSLGITTQKGVPHRRGDEPVMNEEMQKQYECSPQAWG